MPKYRKKPVVVEAEQWFSSGNPEEWPPEVEWSDVRGRYQISTLEGYHDLTDGCWIITGVAGEKYPCKPDIFAATYEKAEGE